VVDELNELLVKSNAGIVDLDNPPEPLEHGSEPTGTTTHQLTELCKATAKQLATHLRQHRGEPDPEVAPGSDTRNPLDAQPAAGSDNRNPLDAKPAAPPAAVIPAAPAAEPDNPLDF